MKLNNDYLFSFLIENIAEEKAEELLDLLVSILEHIPAAEPVGYTVVDDETD